ncbi:MAG: trypsin-like peptidase domain-containing protein, partial [Oscillospiraceae bacterium]|nr:trypsin-like peptidase domain-containing protein [Oscillospiraceae bacterium]
MKRGHFFIALVAVCIAASGATAFFVTTLTQNRISRPANKIDYRVGGTGTHFAAWSAEGYPDLTFAAENAVRAVVNIEVVSQVAVRAQQSNPLFEFFGIPDNAPRGGGQGGVRERRSGGSGVIISPDGYIVTNSHVVDGATRLRVKLHDDRLFDATLIGQDPSTDVALIKIDADDLPTLPFGNSDQLRLGEWVLAIGSPFDLRSTITAGIVSAKARSLRTPGDR